jgi:hypothetical protein
MGYGNLELKRRQVKQEVTNQFEKDEYLRRQQQASKKKSSGKSIGRNKNNYRSDLYDQDDYGQYGNPIGSQATNLQRNMHLIGQGDDIDYAYEPDNLIFHTGSSMEPKLTDSGFKRRKVIAREQNVGSIEYSPDDYYKGNSSRATSPFKSPVAIKYREESNRSGD